MMLMLLLLNIKEPHLKVERATTCMATETAGFLIFLQKCLKMGNQGFYSWLYDEQRTAAAAFAAGTMLEAF